MGLFAEVCAGGCRMDSMFDAFRVCAVHLNFVCVVSVIQIVVNAYGWVV